VVVERAPCDDPAHVRPEAAIARRMRIAFHVSILVMDAVRRYPEKRASFKRQRCAEGDEIFEPLVRLETAMREQPVIRNPNAQAPCDPPQKHRDEKSLPGKHEKRRYGAYVKCDHEKGGQFSDWFPKRPVTLEKIHECGSPWWLALVCVYLIQGYQPRSWRIVILV
jgi:hypothetical protein